MPDVQADRDGDNDLTDDKFGDNCAELGGSITSVQVVNNTSYA